MIKTKSRSCKGVNSIKNDKICVQNMTIILRYKIAMFNFGAHGFNVKSVNPKNISEATLGEGHTFKMAWLDFFRWSIKLSSLSMYYVGINK